MILPSSEGPMTALFPGEQQKEAPTHLILDRKKPDELLINI